MVPREEPYCGERVLEFVRYYNYNISGYVNIPICLIGSVLNAFNVLVFTQRNMVSPVNLIFAHVSFLDLIVLLINGWHFYIDKTYSELTQFIFYWAKFAAVLNAISVWLTMMLTIWRYIAVVHPLKESRWCNMKNTRYSVIICYVISTAFYAPYIFFNEIFVGPGKEPVLYTILYINDEVLLRLVSSAVMMLFSYRLIIALSKLKKNHGKLTSSSEVQKITTNNKMMRIDRSTRIILVVVSLFLIAQVPLGILSALSLIHGNRIHMSCYAVLGAALNSIWYFNMSITFLAYYIMSQPFRTTFKSLFKRDASISHQNDSLLSDNGRNTTASQI